MLCVKSKPRPVTGQDKEDSRNKGQDGAMRSDVADVAEHKADEHEEEADQRERCGRADHLWKEEEEREEPICLSGT